MKTNTFYPVQRMQFPKVTPKTTLPHLFPFLILHNTIENIYFFYNKTQCSVCNVIYTLWERRMKAQGGDMKKYVEKQTKLHHLQSKHLFNM